MDALQVSFVQVLYIIIMRVYIGDYSFDPLGFGKGDRKKLEINELKNGRLAMLAFSGIVTQAALTGKGFPCKSSFNLFCVYPLILTSNRFLSPNISHITSLNTIY
jgi:hypothetical protein